jgi:hypothetical protein
MNNKLEYDTLYNQFIELENEFKILHDENEKLKEEFKENTIIQSMNEMKDRYDRLLRSSVTKTKYEVLNDKHMKVLKVNSACTVILEQIDNLLLDSIDKVYTPEYKNSIERIKQYNDLIKDLLINNIKNFVG